LKLLKIKFQSKDYAQRDRKAPFAVLIVGDSNIAKSQFTNILFQQFGKVHHKDISSSSIWTRNSMDKFYSGYRQSKWCIVLDDIAQFNPNLGTLDPTIADIIVLINNVTLVAPMADLEDKGVVPVRPDLVLGTTNVEELNAQAYFACPLAVRRRFPYVVKLEVKEEYRAKMMVGEQIVETTMVDASKIPVVAEGSFMDIWRITLSKIVAEPGQDGMSNPKLEAIAIYENIYDFLQMYSELSLEHGKNQNLSKTATETMARVAICDNCFRPTTMCTCAQIAVQSGEETILTPYDMALIRLRLAYPHPGAWSIPLSISTPIEIFDDEDEQSFDNDAFFEVYWQSDLVNELLLEFSEEERDSLKQATHDALFTDISAEEIHKKAHEIWDYTHDVAVVIARLIGKGVKWIIRTADDVLKAAKSFGISVCKQLAYSVLRIVWRYQIALYRGKFNALGQKMMEIYNHPIVTFARSFAVGFILGKCVCFFLEKFLLSKVECGLPEANVQGGSDSVFTRDDKVNPWIKDELVLSDFYVPSRSQGWKNMSHEFVQSRIAQNVVSLQAQFVRDGEVKHVPATAVCVVGHIYMTNNHSLPADIDEYEVHLSDMPANGNITSNVKFMLAQSTVLRIPEKDIAFFLCRATPPRADLTSLFLKNEFPQLYCNGFYIHCRAGSRACVNQVEAIHFATPELGDMRLTGWFGRVGMNARSEHTRFGDCGSPLVGMTPAGPIILGIHRTLLGDEVGAPQVLFRDIQFALNHFGPQVQCGIPSFCEEPLGPLHHKSVLHWENDGQARVYGSTPRSSFRTAPRSNVVDTCISEAAQERGFVKRCLPPVMKGAEVWSKNIRPIVHQKNKMDSTVMSACVKSFVQDITEKLEPEFVKEIVILDDVTTMNGLAGVRFLDKVNRNTSMGYPYRKSKRNFLVPLEPTEDHPDPVEYTPEILEEINVILETYKRGERYMPVFVMSLKDEPVTEKKVLMQKTRGFMGGPAAFQFVCRKYLLAFVRVFQLNPYIFEGAPGMNCNSSSWLELFEHLTKHGCDRLIAGDYGMFDKNMTSEEMMAGFDVIIAVLQHAGWSEEDILNVRCIAEDICFCVCDLQGDFVEFFGSNPSGWALTVILNCIVNSLYMRYAFAKMSSVDELPQFQDKVALITYGDDNAMGVHESIPWFNHTSIAAELTKLGKVYTMADKEAESVPYITIEEVSFLKRRFVPVSANRVSCPLEWASIEKMLTTCVLSKTVCPEKQAIDTIRSAIGEFFQYGEQVFAKNVQKMREIVHECHLESFVEDATFPSYGQLLEAHYTASGYELSFFEDVRELEA